MVSLSSLYKGAKSKISSAKNKVATEAALFKEAVTTTDKAIDKVAPIVESPLKTNPVVDTPKEEMVRQFDGAVVPKSQARNKYGGLIYGGTISAAPSRLESFESELSRNPVTGSRETGGYLDKVVTMGYNAPSALSTLLTRDIPVNTFFGGLDVKKAAGAAGTVLGGIPSAIPQAGIGLAESSEGVKEAKGVKDTAIKVTSVPVKTLMPFMNLIPGVMGFQFGTQATGLDEKTNKGVASAKGGLSDAFQKTGILDKEQADEFGSNVIDMFQLGLSLFGGSKSNQIGGKQKLSDIAKEKSVQAQVKGIESQARQAGLSKADAKQFALESSPMVRKNTPTTLMSDAHVLSTNLKNAGIDIGANSLIPVLGLAYDNYKKSGNEDVLGSIKEAAIQVGAMAIPGAKIKKTKPTPSPDQMSLDTIFENGYGDNPKGALDILESRKQEIISSGKGLDKDGITYARAKEGNELFNINNAIEQAKLDINAKSPTPKAEDIGVFDTREVDAQASMERQAAGAKKAKGIQDSTQKRWEAGDLTATEIQKATKYLKSNYKGKKYTIDGKDYFVEAVDNRNEKVKLVDSQGEVIRIPFNKMPEQKITKEDVTAYYSSREPKGYKAVPKNTEGIVEEWGTQNQYRSESPYINKLVDMVNRAKQGKGITVDDIATQKLQSEYELNSVLKEKPAFLSDGSISDAELQKFADTNGLVIGKRGDTMVVAKDPESLQRVIDSENGRELGLALGYRDLTPTKSPTPETPILKTEEVAPVKVEEPVVAKSVEPETLIVEPKTKTKNKKQTLSEIQKEAEQSLPKGEENATVEVSTDSPLKQQANESTIPMNEVKVEMKQKGLNALRGFINSNINFQGFLNNLIFKGNDGKPVSGDSYLEQSRGVANKATRVVIDAAEKAIASVVQNKRFFADKFNLSKEDLIGGLTHDGTLITKDNVDKFYETYKGIEKQQLGNNTSNLENDTRLNVQQMSYTYDLLKGDQKKLDKLFTPEQQALLKQLDEIEPQTYNTHGSSLIQDGYLFESAEDYVRYVMGQANLERAMKDMKIKDGVTIVRMADGTSRKFNNFNEVMAFYEMMDKRGKTNELHPDERDLASVFKKKAGAQFEPYRTHGAYNRLLSYGESVGQLYGNRFKTDLIDTLAKSEDPDVRAYADTLLKSEEHQNIIQEAYGIKDVQGIPEALAKVGTLAAMYGNLKSLSSAAVSTPMKVVSTMMTDMMSGNYAAPTAIMAAAFKNKKVKNVLTSEGFTTGYELLPDQDGNLNKGISLGAGTPVENMGKSVIATSTMRQKLLANGYTTVGITPSAIADAWMKFKAEKPAEYRAAHEAVLKNTRFVSDVSDSAKMQTAYLRRYLGPIKTYSLQQTKSMLDDVVDGLTLAVKGDPQFKEMNRDTWKRNISRLATYGMGTLAAAAVIDRTNEEWEDFLEGKWNATYGYDPVALAKGAFSPNSILEIGPNIVADLVSTISDLGRGDGVAARTFLRGMNQDFAAWRAAESASRAVTGQGVSEFLLGYDPMNLTEFGLHKGKEKMDSSLLTRVLRNIAGWDDNAFKEDFARRKLDEIIPSEYNAVKLGDYQMRLPTTETVLKNIPIVNVAVNPVKNLIDNLGSFEQRQKGIDAGKTAKQLGTTGTIGEALNRVELDPASKTMVLQRLSQIATTRKKENADLKIPYGIESYNRGADVKLEELMLVNPVLYNDFVSMVAGAQNEENPTGFLKDFKTHSPQESAMIALVQKIKPLETSLGQEVGKRTNQALNTVKNLVSYGVDGTAGPKELSPEAVVKVEKSFNDVNKMFEFFTKMKDDMGMHEDAVALHAMDLKQNIDTVIEFMNRGILPANFLAKFPYLTTVVKNALILRGEEPYNLPTTGQTTPASTTTPVLQQVGSSSGGATMGNGVVTPTTSIGTEVTNDQTDGYKLEKAATVGGPQKYTLTELLKQQKLGSTKTTPKKQTLTDLRLKTKL